MPAVWQILDRRTSMPKVLFVLRAATVPRSTEILPLGFDWVIAFLAVGARPGLRFFGAVWRRGASRAALLQWRAFVGGGYVSSHNALESPTRKLTKIMLNPHAGAGRVACSVVLIRYKGAWRCIVGAWASRIQCCALPVLAAPPSDVGVRIDWWNAAAGSKWALLWSDEERASPSRSLPGPNSR